jgi:hypothetical protein
MNCPKCKAPLEQENFSLSNYDGERGPEIDLKFDCKACNTMFYTFVPMSDFQEAN